MRMLNQGVGGASLLVHDAEQREVIERQAKEIAWLKGHYKESMRTITFQHRYQLEQNHALIEQQASTIRTLREALQADEAMRQREKREE